MPLFGQMISLTVHLALKQTVPSFGKASNPQALYWSCCLVLPCSYYLVWMPSTTFPFVCSLQMKNTLPFPIKNLQKSHLTSPKNLSFSPQKNFKIAQIQSPTQTTQKLYKSQKHQICQTKNLGRALYAPRHDHATNLRIRISYRELHNHLMLLSTTMPFHFYLC